MRFSSKRYLIYFLDIVHLSKGQDKTDINGTLKRVSDSIQIRGANIWILCCASFLASIGLDTNSTILLIGAMLISPLMTPVLGIGIYYFTNDIDNLKLAFKKVSLAVLISVITSLLYFLVTPFGQLTTEISVRIKPTLIDAFIALIGGVVGIISLTRKQHGTIMPGVAVAITLMPPLCVVGYGLSQANMEIVMGATYLFLINIIIICFVSSFIVRWLEFPIKKRAPKKYPKFYLRIKAFGMLLLLFPGTYWFVEAVSYKNQEDIVEDYIKQKVDPITEVIDWRLVDTDSIKKVEIFTSGNLIKKDSLEWLMASFDSLNLWNTEMKILQPDVKEVITKVNQMVDSVEQVNASKAKKTEAEVLKEVKVIFKDVQSISSTRSSANKKIYIVEWRGWDLTVLGKKKKLERIKEFIQLRTGANVLITES